MIFNQNHNKKSGLPMHIIECIHEQYLFNRRVKILADWFAKFIPKNARILDVGCGNGMLDYLILKQRPDIRIEGLDVLARPKTYISVSIFDGRTLPYSDASFDAVLFIDVLHHTNDSLTLLKEAVRVGKQVFIKDHTMDGFFARQTLIFMDVIGNARY